jgi:hypothetical protein
MELPDLCWFEHVMFQCCNICLLSMDKLHKHVTLGSYSAAREVCVNAVAADPESENHNFDKLVVKIKHEVKWTICFLLVNYA